MNEDEKENADKNKCNLDKDKIKIQMRELMTEAQALEIA